jgi:CheY-like chemotaxis protein
VVVGEACNGRHALETFLHHAPHLTLMDFWMPEMDELQAARHLTQRQSDALILMITTDPSWQLEKEARKSLQSCHLGRSTPWPTFHWWGQSTRRSTARYSEATEGIDELG